GRLALCHTLQKVRHLVHEAVLVAYLESRYPPFSHIRMVAIGDMDRAPAPNTALVRVGEVLQPVQVVQVPENRGMLSVNLKSVERLVASRVARGFKCRQGAVAKASQKSAGVINAYLLHLASQVVLAL